VVKLSGKCVKGKEVLRVTLSKVLQASYYQGFATSFSSVKRVVKTLKKKHDRRFNDWLFFAVFCG